MGASAISLGLGLGSQALQLINSLGQLKASSDIAKANTRPTYEIPEAVKESLNLSKRNASMTELPNQSMMEQRLGSNVSGAVGQGLRVADSQANLLDFVGKQARNQQVGMQNIGMAAAESWKKNQEALKGDLNNYGAYEDKQWQLNKYEPYQVAAAKAAALQKAGQEGLAGSLQGLGGMVGQYGINQYTNKYYDDQIAMQRAILNKTLGINDEASVDNGDIDLGLFSIKPPKK